MNYITEKEKIMNMNTDCYEGHQPFYITDTLYVTGGSCLTPPEDAEVVVGLDHSFRPEQLSESMGIDPENFISYIIPDFYAPTDVYSFSQMIDAVIAHIESGKRVHIGCLGGHGRTGMVMSAIYTRMTGDRDGINYVRSHYCPYAVETQEQIDFLVNNFSIYESKDIEMDTETFADGSFPDDFNDLDPMDIDLATLKEYEDEFPSMYSEDDLIPLNFHEDFEEYQDFTDDEVDLEKA